MRTSASISIAGLWQGMTCCSCWVTAASLLAVLTLPTGADTGGGQCRDAPEMAALLQAFVCIASERRTADKVRTLVPVCLIQLEGRACDRPMNSD